MGASPRRKAGPRRDGKRAGGRTGGRDRAIVEALCRWFAGHARELPWRVEGAEGSGRDPYLAIVSEFMLQQTQVSRVLERFGPFIARFPDVRALASARESDVLAAWSGMGYYRRAQRLHAAARAIVDRYAGEVPRTVEELMTLPGVGRYTAGAVASIVFGETAPIVDGNVSRVLLRLEGKALEAGEAAGWAWSRAEELVRLAAGGGAGDGRRRNGGYRGPGVFNEAMMELGATVCVPRGPRCGACPLKDVCQARKRGVQELIPAAGVAAARKKLFCAAVVIEDSRGRLLVERRGSSGMWAGLWQAPTLESGGRRAAKRVVEAWIGVQGLWRREKFGHGTTHRDVEFQVWAAPAGTRPARAGGVWKSRAQIAALGISNAQRRILLGPGNVLKAEV